MKPNRHIATLIFAAVHFLVPLLVKNPYYLSILVFIGIYSITTMGLNLLMGYTGQISLGHAAFFGIGAYTSGILTVYYHVPISVAFIAALVITAATARIDRYRRVNMASSGSNEERQRSAYRVSSTPPKIRYTLVTCRASGET